MTGTLGNNAGGSSNLGGMNNTTMNDLTTLHTNNTVKYDSLGMPILTTTGSTGSTVTITPGKLEDATSVNWYVESDVIPVTKTKKYSKIENKTYFVNEPDPDYITSTKKEQRNIRIKGTSLTLNDLYYDPDSLNHWLFIKDLGDLCRHNKDTIRNIIYYRSLSDKNSWKATDDEYQHKNHLYLFTGPCFTVKNLNDKYDIGNI